MRGIRRRSVDAHCCQTIFPAAPAALCLGPGQEFKRNAGPWTQMFERGISVEIIGPTAILQSMASEP